VTGCQAPSRSGRCDCSSPSPHTASSRGAAATPAKDSRGCINSQIISQAGGWNKKGKTCNAPAKTGFSRGGDTGRAEKQVMLELFGKSADCAETKKQVDTLPLLTFFFRWNVQHARQKRLHRSGHLEDVIEAPGGSRLHSSR